jgi:hypothetical protein
MFGKKEIISAVSIADLRNVKAFKDVNEALDDIYMAINLLNTNMDRVLKYIEEAEEVRKEAVIKNEVEKMKKKVGRPRKCKVIEGK